MSRPGQTALFAALTLAGSFALGAVWATHPQWGWLSQLLMWSPGVAALIVMLAIRREPPRAMGFAFTGASPWLAALLYPFGVIACCVLIARGLGAVTGADVIHLQADTVRFKVFGVEAVGFGLVPLRILRNLQLMLPWLALALAYRFELPERLGIGRHLARLLLWAQVFYFTPGPWWLPPGTIGEELGWRGFLVRIWRDRPLAAWGIGAACWAAFHLPVLALEPSLQSFFPAAAFLLSIAAAWAPHQALYRWSGSVWPPVVLHFTWNFWNPFFLGNQYGPGMSIFGGMQWLINGEGLLGLLVNGAATVILIRYWKKKTTTAAEAATMDTQRNAPVTSQRP